MNLDRFDGYPDVEERRIKKPSVFERWLALGFDPAEEVGTVLRIRTTDSTSCMRLRMEKDFASSDATKG